MTPEPPTAPTVSAGPQRVGATQARVRGAALIICGLLLAGLMTMVLIRIAPTMTHEGAKIGGSTFIANAHQGVILVGLFAWLLFLGVLFFAAGVQAILTRRKYPPLATAAGILGALTLVSGWIIGYALQR